MHTFVTLFTSYVAFFSPRSSLALVIDRWARLLRPARDAGRELMAERLKAAARNPKAQPAAESEPAGTR